MLPPLRAVNNNGNSYSKMSAKPVNSWADRVEYYGAVNNDNVKSYIKNHIVSTYGQDAYIDNMPSYINWLFSEAQAGNWSSFKNYATGMQTAWNDNNQRKYSEGMLQILKTEFAEFLTVELPQEQAQQKQAQAEIDAEKNKKILTYIGVGGGALALLTAGFLAFVKIKKKGGKKKKYSAGSQELAKKINRLLTQQRRAKADDKTDEVERLQKRIDELQEQLNKAYDDYKPKKKKKYYNIKNNVGKVKYLVSFHDGEKKHSDGSPFEDVRTFKNKKDLQTFLDGLTKKGYVEK